MLLLLQLREVPITEDVEQICWTNVLNKLCVGQISGTNYVLDTFVGHICWSDLHTHVMQWSSFSSLNT